MATPVISASSSILGFRRNEEFAFQPAATNMGSPATPAWTAVGLPSGLSINATTGLISGSVAVAGVYVVTISASNTDPATGSREFVIGISSESAASVGSADASLEWDFDVVSREVKLLAQEGEAPLSSSSTEPVQRIGRWKKDDKFITRIRFRKNGQVLDLNPTSIKLVAKETDSDQAAAIASSFSRSGATGSAAYFDLLVDLTADKVRAALSNYEDGKSETKFDALLELQVEYPGTLGSAPVALRLSSKTLRVELARDFVD